MNLIIQNPANYRTSLDQILKVIKKVWIKFAQLASLHVTEK